MTNIPPHAIARVDIPKLICFFKYEELWQRCISEAATAAWNIADTAEEATEYFKQVCEAFVVDSTDKVGFGKLLLQQPYRRLLTSAIFSQHPELRSSRELIVEIRVDIDGREEVGHIYLDEF